MARVKGPLFSLSATGEFKGMEFRTGSGSTVVAAPKVVQAPRRPAQLAQQAAFQTAVQAWKALDANGQQAWRTAAQNTGLSGYQLYISEYMTQAIVPPGQPVPP